MPAVYADISALSQSLALASGSKVNVAVAGAIRVAAGQIQTEAQEKAPKKTGALASSISVSFHGPLTAIIGPGVDYGVYQEFGTHGPYEIHPKKPGGVLVFEINGTVVRTKKVIHPGLKPRPFMRPAAQDVIGKLTDRIGGIGVNMIVEGDVGDS